MKNEVYGWSKLSDVDRNLVKRLIDEPLVDLRLFNMSIADITSFMRELTIATVSGSTGRNGSGNNENEKRREIYET